VVNAGRPVLTRETITIGAKTTTARGTRYLTPQDFERQVAAGLLTVLKVLDGAVRVEFDTPKADEPAEWPGDLSVREMSLPPPGVADVMTPRRQGEEGAERGRCRPTPGRPGGADQRRARAGRDGPGARTPGLQRKTGMSNRLVSFGAFP
jgi:hypothetical protein